MSLISIPTTFTGVLRPSVLRTITVTTSSPMASGSTQAVPGTYGCGTRIVSVFPFDDNAATLAGTLSVSSSGDSTLSNTGLYLSLSQSAAIPNTPGLLRGLPQDSWLVVSASNASTGNVGLIVTWIDNGLQN